MPASQPPPTAPSGFDLLRTEMADLAYDLERRGRLDAADVVMMLEARVRELAEEARAEQTRPEAGFPLL